MTGEAVPILLDLAELDAEADGDLTALAGATSDLLDDDDVALVAAEIEPAAAKAKVLP